MARTPDQVGTVGSRDHFAAWLSLALLAYVAVGALAWHRTLLPDEIRPLLLASHPFAEQLDVARADLVQTPAAWMLARWWMNLFGGSDFAAKSFALLLNIPTIVLFALVARRTTRHWRAALFLFAGTFLRPGASPNLVRMYGLVMLCAVAAMYAWLEWRERGRPSWLVAWVVCMAVAAYAHALALLLIPGFVIATWLRGPKRLQFTLAAIVAGLSIVPWIAYVYPVYRERGIEGNVSAPAVAGDPLHSTAHLPFYFFSGEPAGTEAPLEEFYIVHPPISPLKWGALVLTLIVFIASAANLAARRLRHGEDAQDRAPPNVGAESAQPGARTEADWVLFSLILAGTPVLMLLGLSLLWVPVVTARYLLGAAPALWLALAIHGGRGGWPGRLALGVIMAWVLASAGLSFRLHWPLSPVREAAIRVAAEHQEQDMILIDRHAPLGWQFTWEWKRWLKESGPVTVIASPTAPPWLRNIIPGPSRENFDVGGASRVWFLNWVKGLRPQIEQRLADLGYVERTYDRPVSILSLFEKREPARVSAAQTGDATTGNPNGPEQ